uniref:RRM domain-containing protein n=1 Tax=Alexandrium monilatum TaxID=311494 RepID=A0A7S4VW36_9DINO
MSDASGAASGRARTEDSAVRPLPAERARAGDEGASAFQPSDSQWPPCGMVAGAPWGQELPIQQGHAFVHLAHPLLQQQQQQQQEGWESVVGADVGMCSYSSAFCHGGTGEDYPMSPWGVEDGPGWTAHLPCGHQKGFMSERPGSAFSGQGPCAGKGARFGSWGKGEVPGFGRGQGSGQCGRGLYPGEQGCGCGRAGGHAARPLGMPSWASGGPWKGGPAKGASGGRGGAGGYAGADPRPSEPKRCDLFVGRLADSANESTLRDLFSSIGLEIRAMNIPLDQQQQPKGFAFVSLSDPSRTQEAIEQLHSREVNGRCINVETSGGGSRGGAAEPRPQQGGGGRHAHKGSGGHGRGAGGEWSQPPARGGGFRGWSVQANDWRDGHEVGWVPHQDATAGAWQDGKGRRPPREQQQRGGSYGWCASDRGGWGREGGHREWDGGSDSAWGRGQAWGEAREWHPGGHQGGDAGWEEGGWEGGGGAGGHWVPRPSAQRAGPLPEGRGRAARRGGDPRRLFVRNLNADAGDEELRRALEAAGEIANVRILPGGCSAVAFVEYRDEGGAERAVSSLQGVSICGKPAQLERQAGRCCDGTGGGDRAGAGTSDPPEAPLGFDERSEASAKGAC